MFSVQTFGYVESASKPSPLPYQSSHYPPTPSLTKPNSVHIKYYAFDWESSSVCEIRNDCAVLSVFRLYIWFVFAREEKQRSIVGVYVSIVRYYTLCDAAHHSETYTKRIRNIRRLLEATKSAHAVQTPIQYGFVSAPPPPPRIVCIYTPKHFRKPSIGSRVERDFAKWEVNKWYTYMLWLSLTPTTHILTNSNFLQPARSK